LVGVLHAVRAQGGGAATHRDTRALPGSASRDLAPHRARLANAVNPPMRARAVSAGHASLPPSRVPALRPAEQLNQPQARYLPVPKALPSTSRYPGQIAYAGGDPSPLEAMGTTDSGAPDAGALDSAVAPEAGAPPDAGAKKTEAAPKSSREQDDLAASQVGAPDHAAGTITWTHVLGFPHDALWWFGGEHPSGFSTTALLRAAGYSDPSVVSWRITQGADKVAFQGPPTGAEVHVRSTAGSAGTDDVTIEAKEGAAAGAPNFAGHLTVRKPHHLVHRSDSDRAACPVWAGCTAGCPAYWTEIGYRIVDNVGGTIVGATVNENFPGAPTGDQPNDWPNPAVFTTVPFWRNTNGTFVDNWYISCGTPSPVAPGAVGAASGVDRMPHEFYVGSDVPARGCRVQTHIAHRYLGFTRHESITTPAP